jgi:hypothetical protein
LLALTKRLLFMTAMAVAHPAAALTIVPQFDNSISGAGNAVQLEGAINAAIGTIDGLYTNSGSVGIVFTQATGGFLGQSSTVDYSMNYGTYAAVLTTVSQIEPTNTILATALANLSAGNKTGADGSVVLTSADGRVGLGLSDFSGCFNSGGAYVNSCGQAFDGVITLSTSFTFNYGKPAVAGQFNAINTIEHEINEILGGGGQGSVLNRIAQCQSNPSDAGCVANGNYLSDLGVLDPYRYSAPGTPSFTTSSSATSYLSVDGGVTSIVGFNQSSSGDLADFAGGNTVQAAFTGPGGAAPYDTTAPEFKMLEAIGYNGVINVPEPTSMAVLVSGIVGLGWVRRRQ